jgi:hypothetical protein
MFSGQRLKVDHNLLPLWSLPGSLVKLVARSSLTVGLCNTTTVLTGDTQNVMCVAKCLEEYTLWNCIFWKSTIKSWVPMHVNLSAMSGSNLSLTELSAQPWCTTKVCFLHRMCDWYWIPNGKVEGWSTVHKWFSKLYAVLQFVIWPEYLMLGKMFYLMGGRNTIENLDCMCSCLCC